MSGPTEVPVTGYILAVMVFVFACENYLIMIYTTLFFIDFILVSLVGFL
jgi:hypothetical protein